MPSPAPQRFYDEDNVFESIAEHFDRTRRQPWPECIEFLEALPKRSTVLDIGCGNGRHMITALRAGHDVIGLDRARTLLKLARQTVHGSVPNSPAKCVFLNGDARALPLGPACVDAVLYIATIHHFRTARERLQSLEEMDRVLRSKGTALISAWAVEQTRFEHLKDTGTHDVHVPWIRDDGLVFQRFYHLFEGQEFEALLNHTQLQIDRVWFASDNWYGTVRKV